MLLKDNVITAYWKLMNENPMRKIKKCRCSSCKIQVWDTDPTEELRPIPEELSIADVGYKMMAASDRRQFMKAVHILFNMEGMNLTDEHFLAMSPELMINAAIRALKGSK